MNSFELFFVVDFVGYLFSCDCELISVVNVFVEFWGLFAGGNLLDVARDKKTISSGDIVFDDVEGDFERL